MAAGIVTVGGEEDLLVERQPVEDLRWVTRPVEGALVAQTSAHGAPRPARVAGDAVLFDPPARRVAPGQSIVLYEGDEVVAAATACEAP